MSARDVEIVEELMAWYHSSRRQLPWREDSTPYRVMLSEFMLQQTRVDTVLDYFERFTKKWPTLEALAAANEEEVVQAWAGLGYYSRARNLHRCASAAVAQGGLPASPEELKALPGIGPYTAGAIASIGFQARAPIVDGNVERVLSRLDAREENPRSSVGKKAIWARAEELLPDSRPGDFNQALMELGALVCTPKAPKCDTCPWLSACWGHARGIHESLPNLPKKAPPQPIYGVYGLLFDSRGLLMLKRPSRGLLAGMWEPLGTDWRSEPYEDSEGALIRAGRERCGMDIAVKRRIGRVTHVFSHRRLTVDVLLCDPAKGGTPALRGFYQDWSITSDPAALGLPKLSAKIIDTMGGQPLFQS